MKESPRVLLVDDNPDDRALVIRELGRSFPDLHAVEAVDPKGLSEALATGGFDVVITDYQLHWTDGLAVLRTVKAQCPDCPVVMFTGTGSEEVAVEAMKAGLDDYVLKSPKHYVRLASAVQVALKMAHGNQQLRQAESRYAVLFASVPVGLYRAAANGRILDANPALIEMLRYPDKTRLLAVNLADLYVDNRRYCEWHNLMQSGGLVQRHEAQLRAFDGQPCWVENSARAIREPRNSRVIYEGSLEEIQQRKEAEDERERLIVELQEALSRIRTLGGLLPICAACKRIRDDQGYWNQIEEFIQSHSDAEFTHSFCPDCMRTLYPEVFKESLNENR
jgi:PAS domain S-box-containing protein